METKSKIKKIVYLFIAIFALSVVFTLIDEYPFRNSAYDLGKSTGIVFRHMLKNFGFLGMVFFLINRNRKKTL